MRLVRRALAVALVVAVVCVSPAAGGERRLLLITASGSCLKPLHPAELNRLFLGMPVKRGDLRLRALINRTDARSYQLFLQVVMGMSASTYERRLLARLYRTGVAPPPMMEDFEALLSAVEQSRGTVTFILDERLPHDRSLEVVQELWRGTVR